MWFAGSMGRTPYPRCANQRQFDNLPVAGEPLTLDDDSHVPAELRAGYRLRKMQDVFLRNWNNAKALALADLLKGVRQDDPRMPSSANALPCSS